MATKPLNSDLPEVKKNPYDPQYFWSIRYSELLADASIIAFAYYFSQYFSRTNNILTVKKPWQLIGLYAIVALTLPWYLGYLYAFWSEYYQKTITKIIRWVLAAIILASLIYLMVIAFQVPWDDLSKTDKITQNFGMFSLFLLVLGPMMSIGGFTAGTNDCEKKQSAPPRDVTEDPSVTSVLMLIVLAIAFLVWWSNADFTQKHTWLIIPIYFGSCVAAVLVFAAYLYFVKFLQIIGVYKLLTDGASYLFPLFIVTVLILWNEIGMMLIVNGNNNVHFSFNNLFFILTVSGFIPFRLIMMLTPPLRLINLAIGFLSFAFYLHSISQFCK